MSTQPIHDIADVLPLVPETVTLNRLQANAACIALAPVIAAGDIEDTDTWHGGLGTDLCEFCEALIILRAAAGHAAKDCYRP